MVPRPRQAVVLVATFLGGVLLAYRPAWNGGLLWDDAQHLTGAALQSLDGLRRIWLDLAATQQYYPVVHTAFWMQHRLWGDATLGYHLVNIVLHAVAAVLAGLVLRRLSIPGAWLAAAVFAVHPVHVESVAWIAELKNVLSGVFCLASALAYLEFDEKRRRGPYAAALILFVLALLSKSVTAMLPPVLLVIAWWRRGSLVLRRDVLPLVPFLLTGGAAGWLTTWVEQTLIGARGVDFQFTIVERFLVAGRAICFYLVTLAWPARLVFVYPRWEISQADWHQYLYPLGVAAMLVGLWLLRHRSRAPLAAMLAFCGLLFPALGFFNVYPFRFSLVADHFVYLASIPAIALFSAAAMTLAARWRRDGPAWTAAAVVVVCLPLAVLTRDQSRRYADAATLYGATLRDNPACWLAHVNLGVIRRDGAVPDLEAAAGHFREALRLQPGLTEGHYDLAFTYQKMGRLPEAAAEYRQALHLSPALADAHGNLCNVLRDMGRLAEAKAECEQAVALSPGVVQGHHNLGMTLWAMGSLEGALVQFREAARLAPAAAEIRYETGNVLQQLNRPGEASAEYAEAIRLRADYPEAVNNLGFVLQQMGRTDEALQCYARALQLRPGYVDAYYYSGNTLQSIGRFDEAVAQYKAALAIDPSDAAVHNNLGLALEALGRAGEAASHYQEAVRLDPALAQARQNLARVSGTRR